MRAVDFTRDIKPILAKYCYDCHGADKQKNNLRLDVKALAFKGGEEHGAPIKAGDSKDSVLIKFVSGEDKENVMPPKGERLSVAEVNTLRAWIDQGAVWPDDGSVVNDPLKTHWSYQPLRKDEGGRMKDEIMLKTAVKGAPSSLNRIDSFIAAKLAEKGLQMSPPADARTLCRRLYFDVIGLPPSPEELDAFEQSAIRNPQSAIEALINHLLASPHYGERWARHWLDVVRFAESNGFETNGARPNAWPYRDYVIKAFNDDKPYDQFVREQIAGDAFGADEATGFLVGGATDIVKSPDPVLTATQRADDLNDMVATTGNAFLGLTLNCARCHNHKFDPVSQVDYYSMAAVFAGVKHGERDLKVPDQAERTAKAERIRAELDLVARQLARFEPMAHTRHTVVIHPDDEEHTMKLRTSGSKRTAYGAGVGKGEASYAGTAKDLPTLGDGYWVWQRDNAKGDVFAWKPKAAGRFRVWVSWGSGYKAHDAEARYVLDRYGDPKTTKDQTEIGRADHRKFADGTGKMTSRKLWSGFQDLGVHEFTESTALLLRASPDKGLPTADLLVLQEDDGNTKPAVPHVRLPVKRDANMERFQPVEAKFVRFTIHETTQLQPCIDELEVFTSEPKPRNVAFGATPTASSTLPGYAIHQLKHINDGLYGNEHSWISNECGKGWVQLEFAKPERIDRVVWSRDRDNVPRYNDRVPTQYQIDVSMDGERWQTVSTAQDRLTLKTKINAKSIARADGLNKTEAQQFAKLDQQRAALDKTLVEVTTLPKAYAGKFVTPDEMHRYQRGDVTQPKEIVQPAVLSSIGPKLTMHEGISEQERRVELAKWITDARNPLTARVIVNRLWHYHFGTGIVDTPSDFGVNGGRPTHPELLDWLARELIENDWSLKHIQKLILTSAAYQQSSAISDCGFRIADSSNSNPKSAIQNPQLIDAGNRLLWRFPPHRMEAETLRDTMLAVSGKLDSKMGGKGFDLFEANDNYVKVYTTKAEYGPAEFRRMVYQSKPRVELDNIFGTFDCPDAGQVTPKRTVSTTPLQALSLLNSSFAVQQAQFLAERLEREAGDDVTKQVQRAFVLAFGRKAGGSECEAAAALVKQHGLAALCRALYNANEFIQIR